MAVFYDNQHYTKTPGEAAAAAIKAGLDLDCGPFLAVHTEEAIRAGQLSEAQVNGALTNTITVQMRLGMFDGDPSKQPFGHLGPSDVCTPAHQQLALEAARQGIVLLKNRGPALPLSPARFSTVAVIGPNSDVTDTMIGNYAGRLFLFMFVPMQMGFFFLGLGSWVTGPTLWALLKNRTI